MKVSRRDERLDALLGEEVIVVFDDDRVKEGILGFNDFFSHSFYPGHYKINNYCFRKSHVKRFKRVGDEKWLKIKKGNW